MSTTFSRTGKMTAAPPTGRNTWRAPLALLRRAYASDAPLTILGVLMLGTLAASLVGLLVDPQVITGVPAWIKPAKFSISVTIYAFTLVYLLGQMQRYRRAARFAATITTVALLIEMIIIVGQVVRGTASHFNYSTPLDATLFMIMAASIGVLWTMGIVIAVLLLRQPMVNRAYAWSLRLGMLLALVGMGVAFLMTSPNGTQLAALKATGHSDAIGAHTVGLADGGPSLPFLGWSTVGGDLRIPHFFGLHALQALIVLGLLLGLAPAWLTMRHRVALVWTSALGYLGLIALLTWQALRAQSFVHPDAATLATFAALVLAVVLAAGGIIANAWNGRGRDMPESV